MGYDRNVGTVRAFALDGIPFTPTADANFSRKRGLYDVEALDTTGDAMLKKIKRAQLLESVTLGVSELEAQTIEALANGDDTVSCTYEDSARNKHRNPKVGIHIESHETETGTMTITIHPVTQWSGSLA